MRARWWGVVATWVVAGLVTVAAAHPEGCHEPTEAAAAAAAQAGVDWLADNQEDDGAFLYRYDRAAGVEIPQYNIVRHAGVLLSLAQAEAAGLDGAGEAFERGLAWAEERLVDTGAGMALTETSAAEVGAGALLVAALVEWREATGDTGNDDVLRAVGEHLRSTVTPDGAVISVVHVEDGPIVESRSPFTTGEVAWALAALHTTFPDEGWDVPARAVIEYVATDRDDVERRFPPVSDHWIAYALAEVGVEWDEPLTPTMAELLDRQAGLFGLQARYESQRREEGIVRWTRGPIALGAGVGTLGEGLGAVLRLTDDPDAAERQRCVAGLLVDRQVDEPDEPELHGAWFRLDVTQMDDQQHALSALLAAREVLDR